MTAPRQTERTGTTPTTDAAGPNPASAADDIDDTDEPRRRAPLAGLLTAQLVSRAGNAVTAIAVPLYALQSTGSPLATGVAGVFATVPIIIGGTFGTVLVDRFGYRTSSIVADVASGVTVLAIPILAATVGLPFWALLALVFVSGVLDTPGDTAKSVLLPSLARLARMPLPRAAGIQSAVERSATLVGAAIAGLLVATIGSLQALLVDAASFAVAALLIALLAPRRIRAAHDDVDESAAVAPAGYLHGLAEGLRFLWCTPLLRGVVLLVTLTNAIDAAGMTVLKPLYATQALHAPAALGAMVGCFAAGALTGSLLFATIGSRLAGRALFVGCFVVAGVLPYTAMAIGLPLPALLVVLLASGLAAGSINPMISTVMFGLVPEGIRARVFGVTLAGASASMPLGALAAGLGVEAFGLHGVLIACAVLYAVLTLAPLFAPSFRQLGDAR
ncbi:MFS transporter [Rathayibacter sp. YIM 133350]|uniref:MFS transporter n=1 Tax=Rathayibacter sp. YIM 133350 TaxID=3131992 RepID=UPI00307E5937